MDEKMLFLDEVGALDKIREVFGSTKKAKIAVAFWGRGAIEALRIDRPDLEVEVICNLDSGACNPSEIEKLLRLRPHTPVKSDPRLHGKVYWTPRGVVVGSSNASTNGLAVEDGLAGWAEANIFSDDSKLIAATLAWFEARAKSAYEITDAHLRLAEIIWNDRSRSAPAGLKLAGDLGAAIRSHPRHNAWTKIKLAIYSEDLSNEGKKTLREDRVTNPALREFDAYESWHEEIDAGDWLLDFEIDGKKASFGGYWSVPIPKLENKLLTYVRQQPCVMLPGFGALKLSTSDLSSLEIAACALSVTEPVRNPPYAMVPIQEAIAFIDKPRMGISPIVPDIEAFERAMLDIYKEARKIGYRPTEFLNMIERDGALVTARRLIMSATPSSGFTRLWELKRIDLTVEALVSREPWRRLFLEIELDRAQRRLKQYGFWE
jgi:hypothetical protein